MNKLMFKFGYDTNPYGAYVRARRAEDKAKKVMNDLYRFLNGRGRDIYTEIATGTILHTSKHCRGFEGLLQHPRINEALDFTNWRKVNKAKVDQLKAAQNKAKVQNARSNCI